MTQYEFDLSTVNSIKVEADDGEEAIDMLAHRVREKIHDGTIPSNEVKTFDVQANATGCIYRVAGMSASEAEDNLRAFIKQERDALKESVYHGDPGHGLLVDLNTSCETIEEVDGDWDIGRDGREEY